GVTTTQIANGTISFGDIAQNACTNNQIMKWNGSAWACATDADGTGTGVTSLNSATGALTIANATEATGTITIDSASGTNAGLVTTGAQTMAGAKTLSSLLTLNGGLSLEVGDTLTFNTDAFTDLTGTGLTINAGSLQTTLGTAIDSSEITDGTITFGDISQNACTNNQIMKWNGSAWACATDADGTGSGVTSLNSLVGALSINNVTTSGGDTITIDNASTTAKGIAQFTANDFAVASGTVSLKTCLNTQILKHNGTNWVCASDDGGTAYLAGTGLSLAVDTFNVNYDNATIGINGSDQLYILTGGVTTTQIANGTISFGDIAQNACTNNQIMKWNGSAWACATD
ncbi:MAG: hypothetical protein LC650_03670, partial [Actinobacteria bacterium]|nr:hypothetical protein [Actinomycetota bacterium]